MKAHKLFDGFNDYFKDNYGTEFEKLKETIPMNWIDNEAVLLSMLRASFLAFAKKNNLEIDEEFLPVIILFSSQIFNDLNDKRLVNEI
jgi:hypothetical protein